MSLRAKLIPLLPAPFLALLLAGCASGPQPTDGYAPARLTPETPVTRDLKQLPPPKGKMLAAVYGFRDQTGQYKPAPDSSFSTSVTQGGAALLIKALKDSGWFIPVERENLQDLLTERKIVRALEPAPAKDAPPSSFPPLLAASILIEGGVISYESNIRTGGLAARYLGIGLSTQYRVDQVTVNLRSVDIRGGQILQSISTTKTIYSYEVHPSVFKFVNFKDLVEMESGLTKNEPAQQCVKDAIEAAVIHLIVQGVREKAWYLKNDSDWNLPVVQSYLREENLHAGITDSHE
jgi:curli production assembly/transport component CsgG